MKKIPYYKLLRFLAQHRDFEVLKERFPSLTDSDVKQALLKGAEVLEKSLKRIDILNIYTDGAAIPNPGPSGIGIVIYNDKNEKINEIFKPIGATTNNIAEYYAIEEALKEAKRIDSKRINIFSDSKLLVNQLGGSYKINDKSLLKLYLKIKNLEKNFEEVNYNFISREENKLADKLSKLAIKKLLR